MKTWLSLLSSTLLLTAMSTLPSSANEPPKVYRTTDENGNVVFTDSPNSDGEEINTEPKNVLKVDSPNIPQVINKSAPEPTNPQYRLTLVSPAEAQRFGPSQRTLSISVSLSPQLAAGHGVIFYMNGKVVSGPSSSLTTSVPLGLKKRGRQSVKASVVDKNGKSIASTPTVSVYVIRPN